MCMSREYGMGIGNECTMTEECRDLFESECNWWCVGVGLVLRCGVFLLCDVLGN